MESDNISVLLMDDEPASIIIRETVNRLEAEGFRVELVETMESALESYYRKYHDVFVLDIDMSHRADGREGNGIKVLKKFISIHNRTRVIMFSGAGDVPEWFDAANAHCFAYVDKGESDSIDRLIALIRSAAHKSEKSPFAPRKKVCPQRVLLYGNDENLRNAGSSAIKETLGELWRIEEFDSLKETSKTLAGNDSDAGIVVLLRSEFSTRSGTRELLKNILGFGPNPNIIIGCRGESQNQPSILFLANLHPHRMINLNKADWDETFKEALKTAHRWYGRQEIFRADRMVLEKLDIALPKEALEHWSEYDSETDLYELEKQNGEGSNNA